MNRSKLSVAGVQILHQEGCREANIERAVTQIDSAPSHDLYVLPELASSGYGPRAFQMLDQLSEDTHGPSFQAFSKLARERGCFICYSFPRNTGEGKPTICAAVVDRDGQLAAVYDKWHICQVGVCSEKDYFAAGHSPPATFEIDGIKVGICICYDIRFPEIVRMLALEASVSLVIHPGGWSRDEGFGTWHPFVTTRAMENGIYIMSPNRAGPENGGSIFCPPFVDYLKIRPTTMAIEDEEGILVGQVDLDHLERVRAAYPLLQDRRPDMYN